MAPFREYVIDALLEWRKNGLQTALVTLIDIEGSSPRALGAQMAVAETGESVGLITGGCAEASITEEAIAAMKSGKNRRLRYGVGSPFVDIRLPCGSSIDVQMDVETGPQVLEAIAEAVSARRPIAMLIPPDGAGVGVLDDEASISTTMPRAQISAAGLVRRYVPQTRLLALGRGVMLASLARMARQAGLDVVAFSPERDVLAELAAEDFETHALNRPRDFAFTPLDRWTAAALLFHDHEWEPEILKNLLASECFYLGVLGSRATHAQRTEIMTSLGVDNDDITRLHAPIGLAIGAKNPVEIALATVAEILAERS